MTDEELDALENNLAVRGKQDREMSNHYVHRMEVDRVAAKSAITALRAQLAEARANEAALAEIRKTLAAPDDWHPVDAVKALKRSHDRAEAALAAQIEADARVDPEKFLELVIYAAKEAREKALREAAVACDWGDIYGDNAVRAILAMIDKEKTK